MMFTLGTSAQDLRTQSELQTRAQVSLTAKSPISGYMGDSRGGGVPPNDLCTGAVPQDLEAGSTVTFTGDNTGATLLEGTTFVVVWEAFTTTTCASVTVNYCVPGSVFTDFLINLTNSCPEFMAGLVAGTYDDCSVTFTEIPAGTWYIPVLVDPATTPVGAYTLTATATACPPGYCSAAGADATYETIGNVLFAGINNSSTAAVGYEDFTSVVGTATQGSSQDITVSIIDGVPSDQILVWIDYDQSESFEAGELAYTSPFGVGPHTGTITIPADAAIGQTRVRIRMQDSDYGPNNTACGNNNYGQVEDYTLNIDMSVGMNDAASIETAVYPNPNTGDFSVRYGASATVTMEVMDLSGRLVHSEVRNTTANELMQVQLAGDLAAGTYMLRMSSTEGNSTVRVIVK